MTVSAKEILAEAEALRETIISDRRALHAAPEAGADLPRTREYVAGRLREMGYEPKELAGGITAEITGSDTGNCVLLRADMDALCVTEQTDLPFRSQNGCMHACGHDMHTAMLLGAAMLLVCDLCSKQLALPVNTLTALMGIPIVVWVVVRNKNIV